ncbi:MAG: type II secretion system F family protein [Sphingopyxis sp.]|uniref:type II secretion system F family protein n=1 Tax=Sphingopyxis sp. TaxID=1908224 RepID=UPI001A2E5584|nr:type II secretion system F family protein [Sphingopyxis sp.]MBJ7498782.1 type II secretion system F family protein [Sphingopyxis sp.]
MVEQIALSPLMRWAVLLLLFALVSALAFLAIRTLLSRKLILDRLGQESKRAIPESASAMQEAMVAKTSAWAKLTERIERGGFSLGDSDPKALQGKMIAAGYRSPQAPKIFTLVRLLLIILLPSLVVLPQLASDKPVSLLNLYLQGAGLAVMGLILPNLYLTARADRRRQEIVNGFPDCLDLMLVCVEAGMGLEAALDRVAREMTTSHPLVAETLLQTTLELRAGASREEALRAMADRTRVDEIRAFSTLLIQSDKLGSSIATTLRIYASEMREKRRMRAEEKAHRLPVLLSIPLVACMLPVMVGVLMLPAAVRVIREVAPAMTGSG